jgi:hypothetical protein
MAALDFPANPSDGDAYENWLWSDAKGAWQAKPMVSAVATTSDVAPLNPVDGDIWYNTYDGSTYVYYVDINSEQWVQVKSDATLSSTLGTRVESLEAKPSGLVPIVPTSISVASGSGSVAADGTVTFSGSTDVRLEGVFSSTYKNYRIEINSTGATTNIGLLMRMRVSGSDYTGGLHAQGIIYWGYPGTIAVTGSTVNTEFQAGWVNGSADSKNYATVNLSNPNAAAYTSFNSLGTSYVSNVSSGYLPNTTQYTGITILSGSTATFGGTVKVYGLR